jgi:hypothetical protein
LKGEEEAKLKADLEKAHEEANQKPAEEAELKADEEAKLKAELEKSQEEARQKAAEEAKLKAEEEARLKAELEKAQEEARQKAAEDAKLKAEEEARVKAEREKVQEARARLLHDAIAGLGTDEDELIRVICQTSVAERQQLKDVYASMYKANLVDKVRGDTSGDFQKALLCMLNATEKPFDLEADCQAMYEAMCGWGTDETVLVELICGKTKPQMQLVNEKFKELYDRELYDFVRSETSGHFQAVMLGWIEIHR